MSLDELLKLTADAGVHVSAAEDALADDPDEPSDPGSARVSADAADATLAALRERWPGMSAGERQVVGASAAVIRRRLDAVRAGLPRRAALSEVAPVSDPEEDADPAA